MRTNTDHRQGAVALRVLSLTLALVLVFAVLAPGAFAVELTHGDLLRYIPVGIVVKNDSITVYGYFTNLNADCTVADFRDYSMDVYVNNILVASGYFGTLDSFVIQPLDVHYHTFVFPGKNNFTPGAYVCEDDDFAIINCTFDFSELVFRSDVK